MKVAQKIIKLIESSIEDFNGAIPGLEKQLYKDLVKELQKLTTKEGMILTDVNNLKLIGNIRNKLEKIILNDTYLGKVQNYVQAFDLVTALHVEYFQEFNTNFKPAKTLKVVRELAVDATLNSLTETGINANVLDPVQEMLRVNITSGGSFADLLEGLQNKLITTDKVPGSLLKYTKQITTDAINQYSANYQKIVAEDLGLVWHRYVGSNIETTREFCEWLTKKDYVHKSELAAIIKGKIDGHQCAIYKKTGLPYGMIPETNVSNFETLRGGYQCGHQFFSIPTSVVPVSVINQFAAGPKVVAKEIAKPAIDETPKPVEPQQLTKPATEIKKEPKPKEQPKPQKKITPEPDSNIKATIATLESLEEKITTLADSIYTKSGYKTSGDYVALINEWAKVKHLREALWLLDQQIDISTQNLKGVMEEFFRNKVSASLERNIEKANRLIKSSVRVINNANKLYDEIKETL